MWKHGENHFKKVNFVVPMPWVIFFPSQQHPGDWVLHVLGSFNNRTMAHPWLAGFATRKASSANPKDHWTLKTGYFEDQNTPGVLQVHRPLPLEGPRTLGEIELKKGSLLPPCFFPPSLSAFKSLFRLTKVLWTATGVIRGHMLPWHRGNGPKARNEPTLWRGTRELPGGLFQVPLNDKGGTGGCSLQTKHLLFFFCTGEVGWCWMMMFLLFFWFGEDCFDRWVVEPTQLKNMRKSNWIISPK